MTQDEIVEMAVQAGFDEHHAKFDLRIETFANLVAAHKCEELARKMEKMPFGDTAASFALWIREQK